MSILSEQKKSRDFESFKLKVKRARAPLSDRYYDDAYYSRRRRLETLDKDSFTVEDIRSIIRSGDLTAQRILSKHFYRTNSNYRNNIDFLARLYLYDTIVIPVLEKEEDKSAKNLVMKAFYNSCNFVEKLDCRNLLGHITTIWLINGIYYGIVREYKDKFVVQDLPHMYCRTRFKDFNNLNILEFNLHYFEDISKPEMRLEALASFPESIQVAYSKWKTQKLDDPWIEILGGDGGVCFCFEEDSSPMLLASIPDLQKLDDATDREGKRDENELYKLLIQRMPIEDRELVFQLDEVADIHASVANMLSGIDTVDVLTTFGETSLENLQDTTSASQSADRIDKYRKTVWDALGRGEILFNASTSSALAYSIKKDETIMKAFTNIYESWIKVLINERFARKDVKFDFQIVPTTRFNQQDMQTAYFRGAQYGYSKMFAGVAMGIKQMEQISLMDFENDFLKMSEKMIPLQSSYTTSGNVVAGEEKSSSSQKNTTKRTEVKDITNTGGRPELPDEQKSDKTQANIAAS